MGRKGGWGLGKWAGREGGGWVNRKEVGCVGEGKVTKGGKEWLEEWNGNDLWKGRQKRKVDRKEGKEGRRLILVIGEKGNALGEGRSLGAGVTR